MVLAGIVVEVALPSRYGVDVVMLDTTEEVVLREIVAFVVVFDEIGVTVEEYIL